MSDTDAGDTQWLELSPPFEGWDCPCGSEEPGPDELYCSDCLESLRAEYKANAEGLA